MTLLFKLQQQHETVVENQKGAHLVDGGCLKRIKPSMLSITTQPTSTQHKYYRHYIYSIQRTRIIITITSGSNRTTSGLAIVLF